MDVHSIYTTVLASLEEDMIIPPINQIPCLFFGKQIFDKQYGGLAFEEEGQRCSNLLKDESFTTMIMGNHGLLVIVVMLLKLSIDYFILKGQPKFMLKPYKQKTFKNIR